MNAPVGTQQQAWQALIDQPLSFVRSAFLRECLPAVVTDQQLASLRGMPRFHERLLQLLTRQFNVTPLSETALPKADDLTVLLLPPSAFRALSRLCGAIWHGATLSREIRSEAVSHLRDELGNTVFSTALNLRAMAGAADLLRQPAELVQAIDRDGASCVAAWLQQLPSDLQPWLRLRLELPTFDGVPISAGPDIVRRAAMSLAQAEQEEAL